MTIRIGLSHKVVDNHVGGNTRYARSLYEALGDRVELAPIRPARGLSRLPKSAQYMLAESLAAIRPGRSIQLLHFPADTGSLLPSRIPIVATIHGCASLHVPGVRKPAAETTWRARVGRLAAVSRLVVTVSESSRRDLGRLFGIPEDRIRVIHHGIDTSRFSPTPGRDDDETLTRYGLASKEYLLYLGNLDPRKNVPRLIDSLELLPRDTQVPLVVAGRPSWDAGPILQKIRDATERVKYLGHVPENDVAPLLRHARVFVFPSLYEGFGFPVLEAMASGTAVVTSEQGSLRELAQGYAAICDPLNTRAIAENVQYLLEDSSARDELSARALLHARRFTWDRSAEQHLRVFEEAIA
jgi:glycosyltransferase involved in cell wall biosynthesis